MSRPRRGNIHVHQVDRRAARQSIIASAPESPLLLLGEAGLGKSHVLDGFKDSQRRIVRARGLSGEEEFSLSGFASFFDAVRGEPHQGFGDLLTLRSDDPRQIFAAARDVAHVLRGMAMPPTLVLLDDVDSMDRASQAMLGSLASHLAGTHLTLVATARTTPDHAPWRSVPKLRLAPLSLPELRDLAEDIHPGIDPVTVSILAEHVDGNPLVLSDLLDHLDEPTLTGERMLVLPPPATQATVAVATPLLADLGAADLDLLTTVALGPSAHVAALAASDPAALDRTDDLVTRSVLHRRGARVMVSDPRVRSTLYWSVAAADRRARHTELGRLTAPHDPQLATWHAHRHAVDPSAAGALIDAAADLVLMDRVAEAVELTELALEVAPVMNGHLSSLTRLCNQLLMADEIDLTDRYADRAQLQIDRTSPEHLMLTLVQTSARVLGSRRIDDDQINAAVAIQAPDQDSVALDLLVLAATNRAERWEIDEARHVFAPAAELAEHSLPADRVKVSAVVDVLDTLEGLPPPLDPVPTRPGMPPDVLLLRARALTWRDRHTDARQLLSMVKHHPTDHEALWRRLACHASIGNEILAGRFDLALEAISQCDDGSPWMQRTSAARAMRLAWREYILGDLPASAEHLERAQKHALVESNTMQHARALSLRAHIDLLDGDHESAVANLRQVSTMSNSLARPSLTRHWADHVQACLLTGRRQEAVAIARHLQRRHVDETDRWAVLAQARIGAMLADDGDAPALFRDAVRAFTTDDSPYELGRTLLSQGDCLIAAGAARQARHVLADAKAAFERAGAAVWVQHVTVTRSIDTAPSSWDRLTAEERDIVDRVVLGERNRDIAEGIHLSVRAVELRLTRIYRTLGVASRVALVALVQSEDSPVKGR